MSDIQETKKFVSALVEQRSGGSVGDFMELSVSSFLEDVKSTLQRKYGKYIDKAVLRVKTGRLPQMAISGYTPGDIEYHCTFFVAIHGFKPSDLSVTLYVDRADTGSSSKPVFEKTMSPYDFDMNYALGLFEDYVIGS